MTKYDIVLEIFNRLKKDLMEVGVEIHNDKGASNRIIIALSEAMSEGIEIGERSGKTKALDSISEYLNELK